MLDEGTQQEFDEFLAAKHGGWDGDATNEAIAPPISKFSLREIRKAYPDLQPPVIEGLLREGETCNVIASPKVGKSWFVYYVALCVIMGWSLFDRFRSTTGKVLLIDNELHRSTLAHRIPIVADAMAVDPFGDTGDSHADDLEIWPLRGGLRSLNELEYEFEQIERGEFKLIIMDAKYRFGNGESENDNHAETKLYNQLDRLADLTGAALMLVHHSSKGVQSGKAVTDVGAGAGAQSRAADCHLVLREHEEPGHIVLDAAVRSFKPVEPVVLKWQFPLWLPAEGMDAAQLKGAKGAAHEQQQQRDRDGILDIAKALNRIERGTRSQLRAETGIGSDRMNKLLAKMTENGSLTRESITIRGNKTDEYRLANSL